MEACCNGSTLEVPRTETRTDRSPGEKRGATEKVSSRGAGAGAAEGDESRRYESRDSGANTTRSCAPARRFNDLPFNAERRMTASSRRLSCTITISPPSSLGMLSMSSAQRFSSFREISSCRPAIGGDALTATQRLAPSIVCAPKRPQSHSLAVRLYGVAAGQPAEARRRP